MDKFIQGVHNFQGQPFSEKQSLFAELANGQSPRALLITCSDSRIVPNLVTQTDPGELFVIRNAGNLVPRYQAGQFTSEAGTIEYAVKALEVPNIIVCGHSRCGAMGGLLDLDHLDALPVVKSMLSRETAAQRAKDKHPDASGDELLKLTIQENVLVQIENLKTHPSVAAAVESGKLTLHGWVYQFETGDVFIHDQDSPAFASVRESGGVFV
ncbi:MAG: carbonic anhydrase [Planctomycetaceae bacterium]|nr:carbonic anhydrase [Planctomycetaceae bacterium]